MLISSLWRTSLWIMEGKFKKPWLSKYLSKIFLNPIFFNSKPWKGRIIELYTPVGLSHQGQSSSAKLEKITHFGEINCPLFVSHWLCAEVTNRITDPTIDYQWSVWPMWSQQGWQLRLILSGLLSRCLLHTGRIRKQGRANAGSISISISTNQIKAISQISQSVVIVSLLSVKPSIPQPCFLICSVFCQK